LRFDAAACSEIGATGLFKYKPSLSPLLFTEYAWVMTDGIDTVMGVFDLGGYPDTIQNGVSNVDSDLAAAKTSVEGKVDTVQAGVTNLDSDLAAVKTAVDALTWEDIDHLIDLVGGNRVIVDNQMIYYKADGITEVARFNLYDQDGHPTMINVMRRERWYDFGVAWGF